jgi:hypothetical protein
VPHRPVDWTLPKIAFPDISQKSKFFIVEDGWIVNGDCYWAKLLPGRPDFWLHLMLAVANSSFIHEFYDVAFHNKLYAGRRRFMSQYVSRFPLPKLDRAGAILDLMPQLLRASSAQNSAEVACLQSKIDGLVWQAFGLAEEVGAASQHQMVHFHLCANHHAVEHCVTHIAMPNTRQEIQRCGIVWGNQTEVNRWRCLQLDFQQLLHHIREIPGVAVFRRPQHLAHSFV